MYFRKEKFDKVICKTLYGDSDVEKFVEKIALEYTIIDLQFTSGSPGALTVLIVVRNKEYEKKENQ